jgi:hypothetical protein
MPHDTYGKLLQVGDEVIIRGKVTWIGEDPANAKFCNVNVELKERMPAYPEQPQSISSINAAQVEKVG